VEGDLLVASVRKRIEVPASAQAAYQQWTRFEELRDLWGSWLDADAEIAKRIPARKIEWRTRDGARGRGAVSFQPLGEGRCVVTVQLKCKPDSAVANLGEWLGTASDRLRSDLETFKKLMEHGA
jgi:uncharacterized membrane protein